MRAQQAKNFEILNTCISKWETGGRMNWPPLSNIPSEIKNILISPKPPKIPTLVGGGAHYGGTC